MPVYFIQATNGGPVKIGTTNNVRGRLGQLRRAHGDDLRVMAIIQGSTKLERDLHRRFHHLRLRGEWFQPTEDLSAFIAKEGQPWDDSEVLTRIDSDIVSKAKYLAALNGEALSEYLSTHLRPVIEREFQKVGKKLLGEDR